MKTHIARVVAALSLLGLLSCQRCQTGKTGPLDLVPDSVAGLVLLEPLGIVAPALQRGFALAEQSGSSGARTEELKAVLGFDPSTAEGLRGAGLEPGGSLVLVAMQADSEPVAVFSMRDRPALELTVRGLAQRLWGVETLAPVEVAGRPGLKIARAFGDREVVLGTVVFDAKRGLALFAIGSTGADHLTRMLQTEPAQRLTRAEGFRQDRDSVRKGPLLIWGRAQAAAELGEAAADVVGQLRNLVVSAGFERSALWIDASLGLADAARAQAQLALAASASAPPMLRLADADALLVASGTADVKDLLGRAEKQAQGSQLDLQAMARSVGVDLNRSLLERLAGGIGAVLYVDDVAALAPALRGALRSTRGVGRALAQVLRFHAVADLTDAGKADMLRLLDEYFTGRGMQIATRSHGAQSVHSASLESFGGPALSAHYAVRGTRLIFGTGTAARFDGLLTRMAGKTDGPLVAGLSAAVTKDLGDRSGGRLYLGFSTVSSLLRQFGDSAELRDPAVRSTVLRVADQVDRLGAFHLRVRTEERGLRVGARLELKPGAGGGGT